MEQAALRADAAVSTAYETFDPGDRPRWSEHQYGPLWSFVANAAGHIAASADLVLYLSSVGHITTACPEAGDMFISCSHLVAANANAAVDDFCPNMTTEHAQQFFNDRESESHESLSREVGGLVMPSPDCRTEVDNCSRQLGERSRGFG